MNPFAASFQAVQQQIADAEARYDRTAGSVQLVAISKTQPATGVRAIHELGQNHFGENYLQEALAKIDALQGLPLVWHFVGHIQSNKTALVAERFDWVHTIDRDKIARRLNDQRSGKLVPLNVCVQVNLGGEHSKSGVAPEALEHLLAVVAGLPRLRLRGLMTLPAPESDFEQQRQPFRALAAMLGRYRKRFNLDTLSMGTTGDVEAAIAEGATMVRIGSALFGPRQ